MQVIRRYVEEVRLIRNLLMFLAAMLALQPGLGMAETVNLATGAYPYTFLKAVEDALSLDQSQRPKDMHAFLSLAFGASSHQSVDT